jgi:hypothetical protein
LHKIDKLVGKDAGSPAKILLWGDPLVGVWGKTIKRGGISSKKSWK